MSKHDPKVTLRRITDSAQRAQELCAQNELPAILADAVKSGLWEKMTPTEARQFQTLTHPRHLGCPFRVLVQSRKGL